MKEPTLSDLPHYQTYFPYLFLLQEDTPTNPVSDRMIQVCTALRQKYVTPVSKVRCIGRSTAGYGNYHFKMNPLLDPMIASDEEDAKANQKSTFLVEELLFTNGVDEWGRHGVSPHPNPKGPTCPSREELAT